MNVGTGVVVPIRAFDGGKARLAPYLDASDRARLFQTMADRVIDAAGRLPVLIVSDAPEVRAWAATRGLEVVDDGGSLDAAADAGRNAFRRLGFARVIIAHADLPLVDDLSPLAPPDDSRVVIAVPCHRDDGTPLLSLPADAHFRFSYGPGSFARHVAEARRLGLDVLELRDEMRFRQDLDVVDDLRALTADPS